VKIREFANFWHLLKFLQICWADVVLRCDTSNNRLALFICLWDYDIIFGKHISVIYCNVKFITWRILRFVPNTSWHHIIVTIIIYCRTKQCNKHQSTVVQIEEIIKIMSLREYRGASLAVTSNEPSRIQSILTKLKRHSILSTTPIRYLFT